MKTVIKLALAAAAAATAIAAPASATTIALNGGSSWSGWQFLGDSTTDGLWASGSITRPYDVYQTEFTLDASQSVTGTKLSNAALAGDGISFDGNSAADLFAGDWQAGDRIVGYGLQFGTGFNSPFNFVGFDFDNNNMRPASSVGANDGVRDGETAGDVSVRFTAFEDRLPVYSVFTSPTTVVLPFATQLAQPVRLYTIPGNGTFNASSYQLLYNISAAARTLGVAGGVFGGNTTSVRIFENGSAGNSAQVIAAAVPEPASWTMLIGGFGLTGAAMRRRRVTPLVTA